jgi:hypothetical protein
MKSSLDELGRRLDEQFSTRNTLFKILILFEDESVSERAKRLQDHLFQHVKDHCRLETCRWDLRHLNGLDELVETITNSDIIIIAGQESSELPNDLQIALKTGLAARRTDRGALVALLGRTDIREQTPSDLHLFLQQVAQESGLNFFPGAFEIPQHIYEMNYINDRAKRMTPTLNRILYRNISPVDYGINE